MKKFYSTFLIGLVIVFSSFGLIVKTAQAQSLQDIFGGTSSGSGTSTTADGMSQEQLNQLLQQLQANDAAKKQQAAAQAAQQQAAAQTSTQQTSTQQNQSTTSSSGLSFLQVMVLIIEFLTAGLLWIFLVIGSAAMWKYINQKSPENYQPINKR